MTFCKPRIFSSELSDAASKLALDTEAQILLQRSSEKRADVLRKCLRTSAQLGWPLLRVPASQNGFEGSLADVAGIAEAMAELAIPYPVTEALLTPGALAEADATGRIAALLQAPEQVTLGLAGKCAEALFAGADASQALTPVPVAYGDCADTLLAVRAGTDGTAHVVIIARGVCREVSRGQRLDGAPMCLLRPDRKALDRCDSLALNCSYADLLARLHAEQILLASVGQVAAMGRMVQDTREYLSNRRQFGSPLIDRQALAHRLADMYVKYELCRASVTALVTEGQPLSEQLRTLLRNRLYAQQCAREVAHETIQLHGGMGMTTELLAGRLAQRVLALEFEGGDRHHLIRELIPSTP